MYRKNSLKRNCIANACTLFVSQVRAYKMPFLLSEFLGYIKNRVFFSQLDYKFLIHLKIKTKNKKKLKY